MSDQVRRIGYLHVPPTSQNHGTHGEALRELLNLLGDGDTLLIYRLDRDTHHDATLQQQLETMGIELVAETGDEHAQ